MNHPQNPCQAQIFTLDTPMGPLGIFGLGDSGGVTQYISKTKNLIEEKSL
jgi:hypothetical protein